jgi:RNA polymerase sigma-70 factor (ECF subfamily)
VRRILDGDRDAEAEMVARYSRGVHFLLLQLTGEETRAEDLHQEAFRLVLEKVRAGELREPDKLPAFIRQLARNLCIGTYRKEAKEPPTRPADDEVLGPQAPTPSPLTQLLDKENAALVRRLLAELEPPRDREILFRYFIAEHEKGDICADFDLSSLHFNRVLHRARQRLKKLLEQQRKRQDLLPQEAKL